MAHFKVAREMLEERGHQVTEYSHETIVATTSKGGRVFVKFIPQKLSINLLKEEVFAKHKVIDYEEFIIVAKSIMASNTRKITNMFANIEIFVESELSFNIMRHVLQPQMKKIPMVKRDFYPHMLETDAVAKFMKWIPGDFIEVTRPNQVSYRLVRSVL
jgi:DNA-directed RNA polymerase subunit H (RpoH/RPB5)